MPETIHLTLKNTIMKKITLLTAAFFYWLGATGQQVPPNPYPRTITVSGSAEMELIPDQIFVHITLREYQKKGEPKRELESIKTGFLEACAASGINDSLISIVSYTGYNNYYWLRKRKKPQDLNASIVYQIRFSQSKQMDELVDKLDDEATQSFDIVNTSHSKITEFRKQLKIGAVKAAREKALYLTDAIQEKLGPAITVQEPSDKYTDVLSGRVSGLSVNTVMRYDKNDGESDKGKSFSIDFKKIRLRFEVTVVFALE